MNKMISYNNGEYAFTDDIMIPASNLGFNRSFGVFDFMRMEKGKILFRKDHLMRFDNSQRFLLGKIAFSKKFINNILDTLIEINDRKESTFKLVLSANIINAQMVPDLIIFNDVYHAYAKSVFENGTKLLAQKYVREFSPIKTLNYLASFQNYERMQKESAVDVLFHDNDQISEASRSNIFMVKGNKIYTPQNDLLEGITRKAILRSFKKNLKVTIRNIGYKEILGSDEVFISSTLKKVMPIVQIENHWIGNGKVGPITQLAMAEFAKTCHKHRS